MPDIKIRLILDEDDDCGWKTLVEKTFVGMTEDFVRGLKITSTSAILWDADTAGNMGSFDLLIIRSDADVDLELTTKDGDVDEEMGTVRLLAGMAYMLGADDSYFDHAPSDAFAGTLATIDRIRVIESNAVEATVTLRAWKA